MEGLENNLDTGNAPEENSQDREEVLRLRKERKEQAKAEKEEMLNLEVAHILIMLEGSFLQREFIENNNRHFGWDGEKMKPKIKSYILKHPNEKIDVDTLADAMLEAPECIDDENCGIKGLLEGHQRRTLMRIAERRKERAEKTADEEMNPYEALFETESGEYYMARLLNMPHLEEESDFMKNCVGTSDSYINRIKKGDIEILSFRHTPKFNQETKKFDIDEPILTIEYNLKTKTIEQIKKYDDEYLTGRENYFQDVMEALRKLKETPTDKGDLREINEISSSELQGLILERYQIFTEKGPVEFEEYDEKKHGIILKKGYMPIRDQTPKDFAVKIFKFTEGVELQESEIAYNKEEISENTKLFIGELYPNIFKELPKTIERVYTKFPDDEVYIKEIQIPKEEKTTAEHIEELERLGNKLNSEGEYMLSKANLKDCAGQSIKLIVVSNQSLGLKGGSTREESKQKAKELGIANNVLPDIVGPELRKNFKNQQIFEPVLIDMESTAGRQDTISIFSLYRDTEGLWLRGAKGSQNTIWQNHYSWAFSAE